MSNGAVTRVEGGLFKKAFLVALVLVISVAFLMTIQGFLMSLLMAALAAGLCQPIYKWFVRRFRGRQGLASGITILLVLVVIVGPMTFFLSVVTTQALEVSQSVSPWVSRNVNAAPEHGALLKSLPLPEWVEEAIQPYQAQIVSKIGEWASRMGSLVVGLLTAAAKGTISFFLSLFIMLYAMFFFLKDGRQIMEQLLYYLPLESEEEDRLVERFTSVTRATLKGTLVIGLVQGTLAGIAFAVAGIEGAAFWGTLMAILSIIPGLGTALVWVPAVFYLVALDRSGAAIGLAVWCAAVVGMADNALRPLLVGRDAKLPDLLILLSTIGGLMLFGATGIVIGPIIAALFVTIWEIYGATFADVLPRRAGLADDPAP